MDPRPSGIETKPIPDARLLERQGQVVMVSSLGALPQGTRVGFEVQPSRLDPPVRLEGKVVSVRRLPEDRFALAIRLHSLTKAESAALNRTLAARQEETPKID